MDVPADKEAQEDAVIESLRRFLQTHRLRTTLVERPDRIPEMSRTYPALTTDALLEVHSDTGPQRWSVDVMVLAAPVHEFEVPDVLDKRLTALAERHGLTLWVHGKAPRVRDARNITKAIDAALRSANRPAAGRVTVDGVTVRWEVPRAGEAPQVEDLQLDFEGLSPVLSDQIATRIEVPLRRKAVQQASKARKAGLLSAVVIDRVGHAGIAQGAEWLTQRAATIRYSVEKVLPTDHYLDAVLLHDERGLWSLLLGSFPGMDNPPDPSTYD